MDIRLHERGDHIAIVTIDNQPRRNAMTRAMIADLAALWDELETSAHRCVIVTGAGGRAFCSGADLSGDLSAEIKSKWTPEASQNRSPDPPGAPNISF